MPVSTTNAGEEPTTPRTSAIRNEQDLVAVSAIDGTTQLSLPRLQTAGQDVSGSPGGVLADQPTYGLDTLTATQKKRKPPSSAPSEKPHRENVPAYRPRIPLSADPVVERRNDGTRRVINVASTQALLAVISTVVPTTLIARRVDGTTTTSTLLGILSKCSYALVSWRS